MNAKKNVWCKSSFVSDQNNVEITFFIRLGRCFPFTRIGSKSFYFPSWLCGGACASVAHARQLCIYTTITFLKRCRNLSFIRGKPLQQNHVESSKTSFLPPSNYKEILFTFNSKFCTSVTRDFWRKSWWNVLFFFRWERNVENKWIDGESQWIIKIWSVFSK